MIHTELFDTAREARSAGLRLEQRHGFGFVVVHDLDECGHRAFRLNVFELKLAA